MLRYTRILLAIASFLAVTLLFIDVTGFAAAHWSWMAKWQLVPALLSLNIIVLAVLIGLTLLFGRVYCSIICPLGIYQDIISKIHNVFLGKRKRKLGRFCYSENHQLLRNIFLGVFAFLILSGFVFGIGAAFASLIEPYGAYGRIATWFVRPSAVEINNAVADSLNADGNYLLYAAHHLPLSIPLIVVAAITFVVVTGLAWKGGRTYCNNVCPVGTILGYLSRFSWLKPVIDTEKCTRCGSCARHCKASCIDAKNHAIDYSRCVTCFDCINHCKFGAIKYVHSAAQKAESNSNTPTDNDSTNRPTTDTDTSRRAFLTGGMLVAGTVAAKAVKSATDGGLAPMKTKKLPMREVPVAPAGSRGVSELGEHCIACQLCITNCPNGILSPSTDVENFMQPVMNFTEGFCRPECTRCSDVCPAGAILPIDVATKSSTKIGTAVVDLKTCISAAYGQKCGNCATRCPAGAIQMIAVSPTDNRLRPLVDTEACIGCGSCEYHCPVGKTGSMRAEYPAIHVEGIEVHRTI